MGRERTRDRNITLEDSKLQTLEGRVAWLEQRLADTEIALQLQEVVDNLFEGVQIISFDYRYIYLNRAAAAHGQRPREELLGRTMMEAYPGIDHTELFDWLTRALVQRQRHEMLNAFALPDGTEGWFLLRLEPVPAGALILSVDVTSIREQERVVAEGRDRLETILACMANALLVTDRAGLITKVNPAASSLVQASESELLGRPFRDAFPLLDSSGKVLESPADRVSRDLQKVVLNGDLRLLLPRGKEVPVSGTAAPVKSPNGDLQGMVIVLRDLTEDRRLERQLQQSQRLESVGMLAGGIAHDFNNALSVIMSHAGFLMEDLKSEPGSRRDLMAITTAADRARRITAQLLGFSRRQVQELVVLDLNHTVTNLVELVRRLLGEHIDIRARLQASSALVFADVTQIEQVLINLVINARDAMPGGGTLTLETQNVDLSEGSHAVRGASIPPGPYVMLAVSDTGTGMDAQTQEQIFEPFFTTKPEGKGSGLGLPMVYGIVKQTGGYIWVYSEPGRGTTFKVYLPLARAVPAHKSTAPPEPKLLTGTETILLVEDEEFVRQAAARILRRAGYDVIEVPHAQQALSAALSHPDRPRLLLSDLVMPGLSGTEVAATIRAEIPSIRVLFMSGYTDDAALHRGHMPAGAFLQKPFSAAALLSKVRTLLDDPIENDPLP